MNDDENPVPLVRPSVVKTRERKEGRKERKKEI